MTFNYKYRDLCNPPYITRVNGAVLVGTPRKINEGPFKSINQIIKEGHKMKVYPIQYEMFYNWERDSYDHHPLPRDLSKHGLYKIKWVWEKDRASVVFSSEVLHNKQGFSFTKGLACKAKDSFSDINLDIIPMDVSSHVGYLLIDDFLALEGYQKELFLNWTIFSSDEDQCLKLYVYKDNKVVYFAVVNPKELLGLEPIFNVEALEWDGVLSLPRGVTSFEETPHILCSEENTLCRW
jgi:hypothetical protein